MEIKQNVSLKELAWWKIGGAADFFCSPKNLDELREAIQFARAKSIPITVLGGGTNVLISDLGVEGLVISTKHFVGVTTNEEGGRLQITVLSGTPKSELTKEFMRRRLAPALFLCGLPGDVGGGVVMNAGISEKISPAEFVEIIDWVEVVDLTSKDLEVKRYSRSDLKWEYRNSKGWQPGIVYRVGVSWPLTPDPEIPMRVKEATKSRLQRQPLELPSCGSTFKNPGEQKAGALIDQAGLKGFQVGGAQVSAKHANFIVNLGGATSADVRAVISHVQDVVFKKFGVRLEAEVKMIGREG